MTGKTHTFTFSDMAAFLHLLKEEFLEVIWPGRAIRASILCENAYPFVVTYNAASMHMQLRATFSCLAVGLDGQIVVCRSSLVSRSCASTAVLVLHLANKLYLIIHIQCLFCEFATT
jgi:hypothetical protein